MKNDMIIDKNITIKCLWVTKSYKTVLNRSLENMQLLLLMSNKRM